jgi:putative oxidoreductase
MGPLLAFLGRLFLSLYFLFTGYERVIAPAMTLQNLAAKHLPFPKALWIFLTGVEVLGGLLLILGARARGVALILAAYMLTTSYLFHFNFQERAQILEFLARLAITGGLLMVASSGPGRFSLDRN